MQDNWPNWLTSVEFALNNCQHLATKESPFYLNYGYHPCMGNISIPKDTHDPATNIFIKKLQKTREQAEHAPVKAALYMKNAYNEHKNRKAREYEKGTLVWLDAENLNMECPSAKLLDKCVGPFMVFVVFRCGKGVNVMR